MTTPAIIRPTSAPEDREAVCTWLREYNHEENGPFMRLLDEGADHGFLLCAQLEDGRMVGGLLGTTLLSWIRIDLMAVSPDSRRCGIGRQLVAAAEAHGAAAGCRFSYVDSMSHQAPGFYEKLGYLEVGRLPDWDSHGHDKVFFMRELGP